MVTPALSVEVAGAAGCDARAHGRPGVASTWRPARPSPPAPGGAGRRRLGGAGALLGPVAGPGGLQITVGSFEGGFALDADRRPVLVLAALDAVVGATRVRAARPHRRRRPRRGGDPGRRGRRRQPAGRARSARWRRRRPARADRPARRDRTRGSTRSPCSPTPSARSGSAGSPCSPAPEATVRAVLASWQEATAAAAQRASPVTGDGSPGDPYRVAVTAGVDLLLTRRDGTAPGSVVDVALAASLAQPLALGAAARADVRVGLLHADLAAGTAALATGLVAVLFLGREDATPIRLTARRVRPAPRRGRRPDRLGRDHGAAGRPVARRPEPGPRRRGAPPRRDRASAARRPWPCPRACRPRSARGPTS